MQRIRPIKKLAKSVGECSQSAIAYGACINRHFADAQHQSCQTEFNQFKACVVKSLKSK
ncbi:hypothetical protein BC833DRAFT_584993 [Globomyces pollinis-pini]|nr:hypothetical protein BC833DRAFT_584993 [Globomyces pollinis-pini]